MAFKKKQSQNSVKFIFRFSASSHKCIFFFKYFLEDRALDPEIPKSNTFFHLNSADSDVPGVFRKRNYPLLLL